MFADNFRTKTVETVAVEKILVDLVPGFIKNKVDDVRMLSLMLEQMDFNKIKKIGHNWKGACPSYGFHYLGEVGKQFEILAQNKDQASLTDLIKTLPIYLKNVSVEYCTDF